MNLAKEDFSKTSLTQTSKGEGNNFEFPEFLVKWYNFIAKIYHRIEKILRVVR